LIGQTLSHYRITAAIGAGGMGEVYRATDTNLGRDVAIKVLPAEVVRDAERLSRFKREAHLLAALNHPNIAAIYGLEESGGQPFLALELVEGQDLKQRLEKGAIPVDEALEIARQIAEALEEAHSKGIVHRDLKPANVKLTPDGKVKVLDFGLAKAWAGDGDSDGSGSSALSQSPTLARTGTIAGVILGTAAYMSPEQARGKRVDKRSDVWSFGVLLWEMLTGRTLFAGETVTDVIAAVVTREPDLGALPPVTPAGVRRLIARCLRKDPRTRLPDIGTARLDLQEALAGTTAEGETSSDDTREAIRQEVLGRTRERWAWIALSLVLFGLASFLLVRRLADTPAPRSPVHFVIDTPEDLTFPELSAPAVSPDGRYVAFSAISSKGTQQLWLRPLDSAQARPLEGTEGGLAPFWSPDGKSLGFSTANELLAVTLEGGAVIRIAKLPRGGVAQATWNASRTIVFASGGPSASLYVVPAAGGDAKPLTKHDESRGETSHSWPHFLPDGRRLLVRVGSSDPKNAGLFVIPLEAAAERQRVLADLAGFRYVPPGHLLAVHDGILSAQRFDAERLATKGEPRTLATSVAAFAFVPNWGWFSASDGGRLAWLSGASDQVRLEWRDRKGGLLGELGEAARYSQLALSPDNKHVVVEIAGADRRYDLWVIEVARGIASRLTTDPADDRDPVWSPDSQEIVYSGSSSGDQDMLRKGLAATDPATPLPHGVGKTPGVRDIAKSWSRVGNTLLFVTITANGEYAAWAASLDGQGPPRALGKGFDIDHPELSPDGRWLAYISNDSGRSEVYVEPFQRKGARLRVSASGGGQPKWRGDGKELFYLSLDGSLMAAAVRDAAAGLELSLPTLLIPASTSRAIVQGPDYSDYAVSADGQRFLFKAPSGRNERQRIHVLLDWPSLVP
jgi:eukaryotic-like serine/threonine-protein kinase